MEDEDEDEDLFRAIPFFFYEIGKTKRKCISLFKLNGESAVARGLHSEPMLNSMLF